MTAHGAYFERYFLQRKCRFIKASLKANPWYPANTEYTLAGAKEATRIYGKKYMHTHVKLRRPVEQANVRPSFLYNGTPHIWNNDVCIKTEPSFFGQAF